MSVPVAIRDLRCPTPACGKKLANAVSVTLGSVSIKCGRCHQTHTISVAPNADDLLRYGQQLKTAEQSAVTTLPI